MRRTFKREINSLEGIFAFLREFFAGEAIDPRHLYSLDLAAEELFTNMVKYNPGNRNEILMNISREGDELRLSLTDFDVDAFDVTQAPSDPLPAELRDRKRGGMGLSLVRQMMDGIAYDYENRRSSITVTKSLR